MLSSDDSLMMDDALVEDGPLATDTPVAGTGSVVEYDPYSSVIEHPKVTAIVPMYNVSEDLRECLESLANQTLQDMQVVMIDDGSLDSSPEIALEFARTYENFEYHRIENQGLGHARNYGVPFARGEWLMFPDSDDFVEPYTFEEMSQLGEECDADIVVGDAVRFNTKRVYDSSLHRLAFRNMPTVAHISKQTDLIYDTTAWNKLFRRSFYLEQQVKWVEGHLYEDIPATIPAHYNARRIAFLNKVVYRWRVRDGQTRSITQNRNEIRNFRDRLYALQRVDEFFAAHVTEPALIEAKEFKWLDLDLKLYVNAIPEGDPDYQTEVIDTVADYLKTFGPHCMDRLRAIDRIKYRYIERKNLDGIIAACDFEKNGMKTLSVYEKNGRFYGKFPFKDLPREDFDMTAELQERWLKTKIEQATFTESSLEVSTLIKIDCLAQTKIGLKATLVDNDENPVATASVETIPLANLWDTWNKKYNAFSRKVRLLHQSATKFKLTFPLAELSKLAAGDYRILIEYQNGPLTCKPIILSGPVKGALPRPFATEVGHAICSVTYNSGWQFVLRVEDTYERFARYELDEHTLRLFSESSEANTLDLGDDELNRQAFVVDELRLATSKPMYFVRHATYPLDPDMPLQDLEALKNNQDVTMHEDSYEKEELWRISAWKDLRLSVRRLPFGVILTDTTINGTVATFTITYPYSEPLGDAHLLMVGKRNGVEVAVAPIRVTEGSQMTFVLDFSDQAIVEQLRDDTYALFVISESDGVKREMMLLCGEERVDAADLIECDGYTYDVNRTDTRAVVGVERVKRFYEKTAQRRKLVEHYVYPALRLLPLKKKTIVFESYWGRQASSNPLALYDYVDANHPEYECIWSVNDLRIPVAGKGKRVLTNSLPYFYYMARASFFVNNVNFVDAYEKRRGQIEIQTMHGTPLKTLGLDVKADFPTEESVKSFLRRCGRWDYLIVQSPKVEEITKSCYAFDRTFLRTGYPRNDELMLRNTTEEQRHLKQAMGIDPDTKLVLYAPTWRTSGRFDLQLDFNQLADAFGDGYTFALRRHHLAMPGFTHQFRMGDAVDLTFEKSIDDVLLATDVLITDYSSLMFDFALLHRPMLFFVYDLEAYRDELRGFNIDLETEAPGPLAKTTEEIIDELRKLESEDANVSLDAFIQTYLPYETGHASHDVFEQVIAKKH